MKKLAIIGASDFQNPLIIKAKSRGIETHVFAWEAGDIGEKTADFFYPISITEKDKILQKCQEIGVDGIASIGSDLANITVAYVADAMGLVGNSIECVSKSTDKHLMREAFEKNHDPSPKSMMVTAYDELDFNELSFPVIVKPVDRSGSRGITKVLEPSGMKAALEAAWTESFGTNALVEQFVEGREFSVEYLSWKGKHHFLALTEKFTTGAPHFIERGHLEPARVTREEQQEICIIVEHALNSLGIEHGASHAEVKMEPNGDIYIIEIGSRMGGDCIGSDLVQLSTGFDYVNAVIDVALGIEPIVNSSTSSKYAAIRFIFSDADKKALLSMEKEDPDLLDYSSSIDQEIHPITDSASRYGFFIFSSECFEKIEKYLPNGEEMI